MNNDPIMMMAMMNDPEGAQAMTAMGTHLPEFVERCPEFCIQHSGLDDEAIEVMVLRSWIAGRGRRDVLTLDQVFPMTLRLGMDGLMSLMLNIGAVPDDHGEDPEDVLIELAGDDLYRKVLAFGSSIAAAKVEAASGSGPGVAEDFFAQLFGKDPNGGSDGV
jgi:hypothetical protein